MEIIELAMSQGHSPKEFVVQVLRSETGLATAKVTFDAEALSTQRQQLEHAVLQGAQSESFRRQIGQTLFWALLGSPAIAGRYRASLALAEQREKKLLVVLRFDISALARLPWELMYDEEKEAYVCLRNRLVRRVPAGGARRLKVRKPLRVLGVVSSPTDLEQLDVEKEQQRLAQALAEPCKEGLIELRWLGSGTWEALHDQLLAGPWHVLHFIGHGGFDDTQDQGILALAQEDGSADLVEADRLVDLLNQAEPMPALVVLNSCSGAETGATDLFAGTAAALIRGGVSAVAAMQYSISDDAASAFARGFYTAIAKGRGVDDATLQGRIAIRGALPDSSEWATPVMYLHGDETHLSAAETLPFVLEPSLPTVAVGSPAGPPGDRQTDRPTTDSDDPVVQPSPPTPPSAKAAPEQLQAIDRNHPINAVAWDPDGSRFVVATDYETFSADTVEGQQAKAALAIRDGGTMFSSPWIVDVAFSPLGDWLATAGSYASLEGLRPVRNDGAVKLWDAAEGKPLREVGFHVVASALAFNLDGTRLATAHADGMVQIWDATKSVRNPLRRLRHDGAVTAVRFSRDGTRLATGSADKAARIWDAMSGVEPLKFIPHDAAVTAVAFNADGTKLATASGDNQARIWKTATKKQLLELPHDGVVTAVAFNHDGTRVATGGQDNTARIWDAANGDPLAELPHDGPVTVVEFSPDGALLATVSADSDERSGGWIWDVAGI
jgi:CHAT domain-containing protein/WD40 domain-containing protein